MAIKHKIYSDQVPELVERVLKLQKDKTESNKDRRIIISIAGIPGSGKSTLSTEIVRQLNKSVKAIAVQQDGFHLYRSELEKLPNPVEAFLRRGAPFTFDAKKFLNLVSHLYDENYAGSPIKVPTFDHKLKDPVEDDKVIDPDTKVIIIEGNYVLLKDLYWNEISNYVDESWFVDVPLDLVKERIIKRHLEAGIAENEQEAIKRADNNDLLNAEYILKNSKPADLTILTR
ncbi:uncharacterized protein AC631_00818 [Debaryomyces fabryi]|uniref:Phosphoribulokinase/uridine kinase domain-containing protein n=1 Tax=Debaryomyces fabryi TaxID=58627 RepID=A0A0V1Q4Q5_9ASCO|nr:uncharacterized protein AC631_00818 [Debaryomyces fabryi]KSA03502.1 hypothetical protein AC631_00818 [Debaryomyces fabryi]CUM53598.1 unnamed protein product [Debaryomyces fabryi]